MNTRSVAEQAMSEYEIQPDVVVDLRGSSINKESHTKHKHVVIVCEDGSEIWLDISCENHDHNFADIRWFNRTGKMKGIGAFTIVNGVRQSLGTASLETGNQTGEQWRTYKAAPLKGTDGNPVTGKGWNGGYVMTLLVDKNDKEAAAIEPSCGNG